MAFQVSLSLYSQMEKVRRLVPKALEKEKAALEREQAVLKREKAALAKEKAATERAETLSVRLDDALSHLEVAGREKGEMKTRLHQAMELIAGSRAELDKTKESLVVNEKEAKDSKAKATELEAEVKELQEEQKSIEAFARLTARAAIMRQHLGGKNPLANALDELSFYMSSVGTERDLDSDDEKEMDEAEVEDEAQLDEGSASKQVDDPPPS